ncbi:MAG: bifunctional 3,4-dihydroxy-2-butanone-4-phosphate synthase/GTP cyclohydrolase II [Formosimonas sp.]
MSISSTQEIIAELKAGRMVVLIDEENRENEGDVVLAADFVTPAAINFMAKHCRGLICLTLTQARCQELGLPMMVQEGGNGTQFGTNFTVSIEAKHGVSTGISAADRALTIKVAASSDYSAADIVQPGHIFPVRAVEGGVLVRAGHTEAGCDLTALAGLTPAAVICEIMKDDGEMARLPDLIEFAHTHGLKIGTITDLIAYRSEQETLIQRVGERVMRTAHGEFNAIVYQESCSSNVHLVLVKGDVASVDVVPVRVHEPLSVLDVLDIGHSTHSVSVDAALAHIAQQGVGVAVLLNCQESAARLVTQFTRLNQLSQGQTVAQKVPTELLLYGIGAQILKDVGVRKMVLLGSPRKMPSMGGFGLEVVGFMDV